MAMRAGFGRLFTVLNEPPEIGRQRWFWLGFFVVVAGLLSAPLWLSPYDLLNVSYILTTVFLAFGLCLIWGFGGILSLGQAAFLGVGGYAYGVVGINLIEDQGNTDLAGPASSCDDDDFGIEILRPCFTFVAKRCPGLACFLDESLQNQRRIVRAIKMAEIGGNDPGCIEERYQGSRVWMGNRQPCRNLNLCSLLEVLCCCSIFCRVKIANGLKADALGPLNEERPRC